MTQQPKKILVATANDDHLLIMKLLLEPEGFVVVSVTNPLSILPSVKKEKPDVVLLDRYYEFESVGMPILKNLRKENPTVRLVFTTTIPVNLDVPFLTINENWVIPENFFETDGISVLTMPFDFDELIQHINGQMG